MSGLRLIYQYTRFIQHYNKNTMLTLETKECNVRPSLSHKDLCELGPNHGRLATRTPDLGHRRGAELALCCSEHLKVVGKATTKRLC